MKTIGFFPPFFCRQCAAATSPHGETGQVRQRRGKAEAKARGGLAAWSGLSRAPRSQCGWRGVVEIRTSTSVTTIRFVPDRRLAFPFWHPAAKARWLQSRTEHAAGHVVKRPTTGASRGRVWEAFCTLMAAPWCNRPGTATHSLRGPRRAGPRVELRRSGWCPRPSPVDGGSQRRKFGVHRHCRGSPSQTTERDGRLPLAPLDGA